MKTWKQFVDGARNFNLSEEQLESVHEFYEKLDPEFFDTMLRRVPSALPQQEIEEKFPEGEFKKFNFILIASSWNYLEQLYKAQNYPASMLEDIRNDLRLWCDKLTVDYGYAGLNWRIFHWCSAVLSGRVLQFGRLQRDLHHCFTPKFSVVRENGELKFAEYTKHLPGALLEPGDPVINIHIPAAGPLKRELCIDAFRKIVDFEKKFHPYCDFRAIVSYSWILDPVFVQLNPKSNLADFQSFGHLFELPGYDETSEVLWRVFDAQVQAAGIDSAKPVSTMQKNVVSHIKAGGKFKEYCLVIPKEEIPQLLK